MEERPKQLGCGSMEKKDLEKERMQRTGENLKIKPKINIL